MSEPTCYYYDSERNRCNCYGADLAKLARAEQLEAENAKLRDELDAAKHDLSVFSERVVELAAENAKLREFASEAFSMAFNFYHGAGTAEDLRELRVEYRELGIEVRE